MSDYHTVGPSSPAKGPSSPATGGRVLRPMGPSSPADGAEFSGGRLLRGADFSGADFSAGPTSPDTVLIAKYPDVAMLAATRRRLRNTRTGRK